MSNYMVYLYLALVPVGIIFYVIGIKKASRWEEEKEKLSSRPYYFGWYATLWTVAPAFIFLSLAVFMHTSGAITLPVSVLVLVSFFLMALGFFMLQSRLTPKLKARVKVEKFIKGVLLSASLFSIFVTLSILISIFYESLAFFKHINVWSFITGLEWSPDSVSQYAEGGKGVNQAANASDKFGSVPLFAGTALVTIIAMIVAVPVGLFSAIYLAEYAPKKVRKTAKPLLEILAGIPTVVYGFFAAVTVSPMIVNIAEKFGISADSTNALSPGIVMGIMIIPFMSSLSDDIICSVPHNLREGALALGTTKSESIKHVVLPAALPGLVSAFLLSVSRAVGETMIVVMAAGLRPNLTANPLEGVTTVTVRIVDALTGDQEFDSLETLSAFGLSLMLLLVTLSLNLVAIAIVRKFHKKYE